MTSPDAVRRALLSVSDKQGLVALGQALADRGVEILSSGGTARTLAEAGITVTEVGDYTAFPEAFDGRVKTLHPKVHGGLLAKRDNGEHRETMDRLGIPPIDLCVVNLYPFQQTVASGADEATVVENIDIGGPALIRGAAKNHAHVTVIVDPSDYDLLLEELAANDGATSLAFRKQMALKAYGRTAAYDAAISTWFAQTLGESAPSYQAFAGRRSQILRYGENPHQHAALYLDGSTRAGVATGTLHQGKELSYNNINDTDAAFELVSEFEPGTAACAIIKHANPCGVALAQSPAEAYTRALACDPVSAFGGIIAFNQPLDLPAAEEVIKIFTEVIIAPEVSPQALECLRQKKNLRLLTTGGLADPLGAGLSVKSIAGGLLVQSRDVGRVEAEDLKVVTKRAPTPEERQDLLFAFRVAKHVKSNAIIYVKDQATVGIGAGQMSRIDSAVIAALKSVEAAQAAGAATPGTKGSVVASDAFFPFADGLLKAAEAGATAVIQPGGSVRDEEVIAAADEAGLAMVFTGMRHFRH